VTGGASGIGLATVQQLTALGATVAVVDQEVSTLDNRTEDACRRVVGIEADVSDPAQVEAAFRQVDDALGGIDVLVANAGISARTPALEISVEEWKRVIDVNLSGVFFCAREAGRRMREANDGGTILMTASTNSFRAHSNYAHYNASKAGVIALAKTLAIELAPAVRVNAVCPGYVATPMQSAEYTPDMSEAVNEQLPLGRHATPEEVACMFAYLASDWGRYVTGQALVIDGGELA
jgi:NAD(P)-dependent dehydrogenase (short-subunit alcohol dehydrogenase family)